MALNPSELKLGNWVLYNMTPVHSKPVCVRGIETDRIWIDAAGYPNGLGFVSLWELDPIRLTPDILLKAGFASEAEGNEYRVGLPLGNGTDLCIEVLQIETGPYDILITDTTADEKPKHYSYLKPVRYLHQLQSLFFALTGEELEIKL